MEHHKALGRGLASLIPTPPPLLEEAGEKWVRTIPIDSIVPNRLQPRKHFNEESLKELSESIKEQGIIESPVVTRVGEDRYELIVGERRWRAAKLAGLTEIPVVIKEVDTQEMLELSLVENIQREDLNPIEEARGYQELIREFGLTQDEVAAKVGKSRATIANSVRLLGLPRVIQEDVAVGRLSSGHARVLLAVPNLETQLYIRETILKSSLTVRDVERMVQEHLNRKVSKRPAALLSPQLKSLVDEMIKVLATKVKLVQDNSGKKGKIVIEYYSPQDLDRIYTRIVK